MRLRFKSVNFKWNRLHSIIQVALIQSVEGLKDMDLLLSEEKFWRLPSGLSSNSASYKASLQLTLPIPDLAVLFSLLFYPYAQSICSSDPQLIDPSSFCWSWMPGFGPDSAFLEETIMWLFLPIVSLDMSWVRTYPSQRTHATAKAHSSLMDWMKPHFL